MVDLTSVAPTEMAANSRLTNKQTARRKMSLTGIFLKFGENNM